MSREFEALAAKIAERAGELAKNMRVRGDLSVESKTSAVDMVTEADRATEKLITKLLFAERPDDAFLGEESGQSGTSKTGITWVIDPIDGTTNYLYGLSAACVSIAATVASNNPDYDTTVWQGDNGAPKRRTIAAAVYNPFTEEMFTASAGNGSTLNGKPIRVSENVNLATSLIGTGFGYSAERRAAQAEILAGLLPRVRDIRRLGSAAYDLCLLAAGRLDGYYEWGIQEWDFAAGALIAAEAGASLLGRADGSTPGSALFIAANHDLALQLQAVVGT